MPSKVKQLNGSGALLERLWGRFVTQHAQDFPGNRAVSKRVASGWLLADSHALARWTNDAAHKAGYPQWRIPLRRVPEVCYLLHAGPDELDELMFVRLEELQQDEEKSDALTVMHWLAPMLIELTHRPALDGVQRQLVEVFSQVRDSEPEADSTPSPWLIDSLLEENLREWTERAVSAHERERWAEDEGEDSQLDPAVAERARKVVRGLAQRRAAASAGLPPERQMRRRMSDFRKALKAAKPAPGPEEEA